MTLSIFHSLISNPVYAVQSAEFVLSGKRIESKMEPQSIYTYKVIPPISTLEISKTTESDVFILEIRRHVEAGWPPTSHYDYSADIATFNGLIDWDNSSLEGKLKLADEEKWESYNFKILKPGYLRKKYDKDKQVQSLLSTYVICGAMVPLPPPGKIVSLDLDSRDRWDLLIEDL